MNFLKKFLGTSPTDEIALLPSGKLFLSRPPKSPKGELECLYNDAFASIRKTTTEYCYQLCITKVYQEGEIDAHAELFGDSDDDDDFDDHDTKHSIADMAMGTSHTADEWNFIIREELSIYLHERSDGSKAISWNDLNGDIGDQFEFVIDEDVKLKRVKSFMKAIYRCLYEQKYHEVVPDGSDQDLYREFTQRNNDVSAYDALVNELDEYKADHKSEEEKKIEVENLNNLNKHEERAKEDENSSSDDEVFEDALSSIDEATVEPPFLLKEVDELKYKDIGSFHGMDLYYLDASDVRYRLISSFEETSLRILDLNNWQYCLVVVCDEKKVHFNCIISKLMNPCFDYDKITFTFNQFSKSPNGHEIAHAWLLRFHDPEDLEHFQFEFMKAMWQTINKSEILKTVSPDYDYVVDAFTNMSMRDRQLSKSDLEMLDSMSDEEGLSDEESYEESSKNNYNLSDREDNNPIETELLDSNSLDRNSNLTVGYANDRAYVVRGDKLGVFKEGDDNLSFQTTISNILDLEGKKLQPKKLMLHMRDRYMIVSDKDINDKKLYKLDLDRGRVVEEWDIDNDIPLKDFGPNSKFAQLSDEPTLQGVSANKIFRIDPRLPGTKMVEAGDKLKVGKYKYLTMATTESGLTAVGSDTGDIRLFDNINLRAKCLLPSLLDPVIGLDVSKDGRWLLATCKNYLLLIDTLIGKGQRNTGFLSYEKPFDVDKKPKPRRLALLPEHLTYMFMETDGRSLSFTKAYFNTGLDLTESTIVTSMGPFLITWSLKKILSKPNECPYLIRKYTEDVVADNFRFGSNSEVVLALKNDVSLVNRNNLLKAGRKSIYKED